MTNPEAKSECEIEWLAASRRKAIVIRVFDIDSAFVIRISSFDFTLSHSQSA